jgi:hypothetical protein
MIRRANQTHTADLSISKIAVPNPAQKPAARIAFVPPVRPLSTCRISFPVLSLTINKPDGTEPRMYEPTNNASENAINIWTISSTKNQIRYER